MKLSRSFRSASEERGIAIRHQMRLQAFDPLPAAQLAKRLGIDILSPLQLNDTLSNNTISCLLASTAWSAVTVLTQPPLVLYHPLHAAARFESSVMHELAHILLAHRPEDLTVWSKGFSGRSYPPQQEKEAEFLGACLQVTRVGIDWANGESMCLCEAAEHFGASRQMMQFRLNATRREMKRCDRCNKHSR